MLVNFKNFKIGDRVKTKYHGIYYYGEITIVKENESKILWDDPDWAYWYWPNNELELVSKNE